MTKLDDVLINVTRLGFDTSPIIYFVEANPQYDALVTEIFQRVSNGAPLGVTSVITLSEVLVQPIIRQQTLLQREYRDLLCEAGTSAPWLSPHPSLNSERSCALNIAYGRLMRCKSLPRSKPVARHFSPMTPDYAA